MPKYEVIIRIVERRKMHVYADNALEAEHLVENWDKSCVETDFTSWEDIEETWEIPDE